MSDYYDRINAALDELEATIAKARRTIRVLSFVNGFLISLVVILVLSR